MLKFNRYKYNKINKKNYKVLKIKVLIDPKLNRYGYIEIGYLNNNISAWLKYEYSNWFYCKFISYSSHLEDINKMPDYNDNDDSFDKFIEYIINNWNLKKYNENIFSFNKEINEYFLK